MVPGRHEKYFETKRRLRLLWDVWDSTYSRKWFVLREGLRKLLLL